MCVVQLGAGGESAGTEIMFPRYFCLICCCSCGWVNCFEHAFFFSPRGGKSFELFFFYLFSAAGLRIRVFFLAVLYTMSLALFSFPSCWGWVVLHACSLFGAVAVQGFVVCSIYAKRSANDTCVFEVCVRFTNLIL